MLYYYLLSIVVYVKEYKRWYNKCNRISRFMLFHEWNTFHDYVKFSGSQHGFQLEAKSEFKAEMLLKLFVDVFANCFSLSFNYFTVLYLNDK